MDSWVLRKPQQQELCADFSLVLEEQRCMMKPGVLIIICFFIVILRAGLMLSRLASNSCSSCFYLSSPGTTWLVKLLFPGSLKLWLCKPWESIHSLGQREKVRIPDNDCVSGQVEQRTMAGGLWKERPESEKAIETGKQNRKLAIQSHSGVQWKDGSRLNVCRVNTFVLLHVCVRVFNTYQC